MRRYRASVAGGGFIGAAHAEALRRLPNVEVAALCDRQDGAGKAAALGIPAGYQDVREMLEREKPDTLHICTPNSTHYELARLALERGVHVVCEKPFCTDLEQARELTALAEQKGLRCGVNFHNRFYPMAAQMRQMIREGELGRIFTVHGGYIQDWLLYETDYSWRLLREYVGETRAVGDIGSHWMDLVEYVTGLRVVQVLAEFSTVYPVRRQPLEQVRTFERAGEAFREIPIDTEDAAMLLFRFDNGAVGSGVISQVFAGKKNELTLSVSGSCASVQWDGERGLNELWIGRRDQANGLLSKDPGLLSCAGSRLCSYPGGHSEGFADAFKQAFAQFYASLEQPEGQWDYATFRDGLREMELCRAICESARTGRWVDVEKH